MEVIQSLISAASGLAGVLLGGWLTSRNTSKEKLVELRRNTYGSILYDLSEVESLVDAEAEYVSEGGWDRYFMSDARTKLTGKLADRMTSIRKRSTEDYLVISDEFRAIYDKFLKEISTSDEETSFYEEDDTFAVAVRKYRPLLLSQARRETMR